MMVAIIIQGCCEEEWQIVGNGEATIYDDTHDQVDTVKGAFKLLSIFETRVTGLMNKNMLINTALATSCYEKHNNHLLTASLILNKPFEYEGGIIEVDSNLFSLDKIEVSKDSLSGFYEINFTSDFLQNAKFEKGDHEFKIKAETSDGLLLENKVTVYIDLE